MLSLFTLGNKPKSRLHCPYDRVCSEPLAYWPELMGQISYKWKGRDYRSTLGLYQAHNNASCIKT